MKNDRNYGIDILRLVLMYMVCILHTLGQGGILKASGTGTLNFKIFWLLELLSYCAVDGFALISGYVSVNKNRKFDRLIEMWFQAFFYSFIITIILILFGVGNTLGIKELIKCALPVTFEKFWYFTAFFGLYLAMPILNKFLFAIKEETEKKMFIIMIILFSVIETFYHTFKTARGYSLIWLIVLYCIGFLAKKIHLFEKKKSITLIFLWIIFILTTWSLFVYENNNKLITYTSPTILFTGIIMVVLFSRIKVKGNLIKKISPLAFGIYLFQSNQIIWNNIIRNRFIFVVNKSLYIGIALVIIISFCIFISGLFIDFLRSKIAKLIKIEKISIKIDLFINKVLSRFFIFLK